MDAQNVYTLDRSGIVSNRYYKSTPWNELENIVFQFQKTQCSIGLNSKKCMGNARGDQFNSEFCVI